MITKIHKNRTMETYITFHLIILHSKFVILSGLETSGVDTPIIILVIDLS